MQKFYTTSYTKVRTNKGYGNTVTYIPVGSTVTVLETDPNVLFAGKTTTWHKIAYKDITGWAYAGFFDPLVSTLPQNVFKVSMATPDEDDVPQNLIMNGMVLVNQCGELCIAYVLDIDIAEVINAWQRKDSWSFRNVYAAILARINGGKDRGTGVYDLLDALSALDWGGISLSDVLYDDILENTIETPARLEEILEDNHIISGVYIDSRGRLAPRGILHWVVLEKVLPNDMGGKVFVANPYSLNIEEYSWNEYYDATGHVPDGIVVKRIFHKEIGEGGVVIIDNSEILAARIIKKKVEEIIASLRELTI